MISNSQKTGTFKLSVFIFCIMFLLPLFTGCVTSPVYKRERHKEITREDTANIVFDEVQQRIIRRYFGVDVYQGEEYEEREYEKHKHKKHKKNKHKKNKHKGKGLPPGLAKRGGHLPPGLAKRGGHLPPGLAKRALPSDLDSQLPRLPHGYERVIVDNKVLLIKSATGVILDMIEDAIDENNTTPQR
jgi:hypothetical protein